MFENACRIMKQCFAAFGGGAPQHPRGKIHASACMISNNYAVTALHNIIEAKKQYSWPMIYPVHGSFKCELVKAWETEDIALVKLTDIAASNGLAKPSQWPSLESRILELGMQLGCVSRLIKDLTATDSLVATYFTTGYVSFFTSKLANGQRFILSGGFSQAGFSGSPIFDSNANLLAISTQSCIMNSVHNDGLCIPFSFPQVSKMPSFDETITQLVLADRVSI